VAGSDSGIRVFLFDVDGTLIWAHGAGRISLNKAMVAVYGVPAAYENYDTRGKTDPRIVYDVMHLAGMPDDVIYARLQSCFEAYVCHLEELINDGHPVQAMPGIPDLVRALSVRRDSLVGLLTGNIESGARAKLRPTGLLPFFSVGAYGSDDGDRRRLPAIVRKRVRALTGFDIPYEQFLIIGDTPLDVDCARACGAKAVAVATGQHTYDELASCSPDLLFTDFSDVAAALRTLTQR
jgi:phosphoglycolate phosphatase-like HAD superfamily hydrolase